MKRADLKVGTAYWYTKRTNWQDSTWDSFKVVVVDTGRWERPRSFSRRWDMKRPEPVQVTKGGGVLVDMYSKRYNSDEIEVTREVVNLTHIRGEYEATKAEIEKTQDRQAAYRKAESEKHERNREITKAVADLAKEMGLTSVYTVNYGGSSTAMAISAEELTTLLAKAKAYDLKLGQQA